MGVSDGWMDAVYPRGLFMLWPVGITFFFFFLLVMLVNLFLVSSFDRGTYYVSISRRYRQRAGVGM